LASKRTVVCDEKKASFEPIVNLERFDVAGNGMSSTQNFARSKNKSKALLDQSETKIQIQINKKFSGTKQNEPKMNKSLESKWGKKSI
jgi:hypothetical protein